MLNISADCRIPAYLLVPKGTGPFPAIIALHDHGGFYLWGREKLLDNDDEHPVMTDFKKRFYGGRSIAVDLARQGYVVLAYDMVGYNDTAQTPHDFAHRPRGAFIAVQLVGTFNQAAALGIYTEVDYPGLAQRARVVDLPVRLSRTPGGIRHRPPTIGEHTDEVLAEFGFNTSEIAALRQAKAV